MLHNFWAWVYLTNSQHTLCAHKRGRKRRNFLTSGTRGHVPSAWSPVPPIFRPLAPSRWSRALCSRGRDRGHVSRCRQTDTLLLVLRKKAHRPHPHSQPFAVVFCLKSHKNTQTKHVAKDDPFTPTHRTKDPLQTCTHTCTPPHPLS